MASLPLYELKTKTEGETQFVWDPIRKKYFVLTPEEYVRQCLVRYLQEVIKVPLPLMSLERGLKYNTLAKRYDLVIYDRNAKPLIAAECKRPTVAINDQALRQLAVYNDTIGAPYLLLTNGKVLITIGKDDQGTWQQLPHLPEFSELIKP